MTVNDLIKQLNFSQFVINKVIEDFSHADSLKPPESEGNCANWVLGHIVSTRLNMTSLLGAEHHWTSAEAAPYVRGAEALKPENAMHLNELKTALDVSYQRICTALPAFEPRLNDLAEGEALFNDNETYGDRLSTLLYHEAFHAGQLGLLRRLLGKPRVF